MTDPPQRKTSLSKGPHRQKKKTLQSSPLSTSPLQTKKKGELVSPVKRQLRRTNRNNIPGRERKEKKRDSTGIHVHPATIFSRAAGITSIPAITPLPPGRKDGGRRFPVALWSHSICLLLWQGADKSSAFWGESKLLCSPLCRSLITFTFTFMHLADAFIQSDLHCIQVTVFLHFISSCFPWESNPRSWRC